MLRHNSGMRPSAERASELVNHAQVDSGAAELLRDADRASGWILLVDGTPQSYVDLDDPQYLDFEYVRRLGTSSTSRPSRASRSGCFTWAAAG